MLTLQPLTLVISSHKEEEWHENGEVITRPLFAINLTDQNYPAMYGYNLYLAKVFSKCMKQLRLFSSANVKYCLALLNNIQANM